MTLIDQYLEELGSFLPAAQRDDILRELDDAIRAKAGESVAALGRALTDAEQRDLLAPYGSPVVLAARYRSERAAQIAEAVPMLRRWSPGTLARPFHAIRDARRQARPSPASLAFGALFGAWWLLGLKFPRLLLGGGADIMEFAPIVHQLYPLLVAVQLLMFVYHAALVFRPEWMPAIDRSWLVATLRMTLAGAFVGFVVFDSHDWVVGLDVDGARPMLVALINRIVSLTLMGVAIATAFVTSVDVLKLLWTQWHVRPQGV